MSAALEQARAAYGRRDWPMARNLFQAARGGGELSADDLYALSDAAWWLGENEELFAAGEGAYRLYLQNGQPRRAAMMALDIAVAHFLRGDDAIGSGWIGQAVRLLEGETESAEQGYLLYLMEVEGPLGGIAPSEPTALESLLEAARRVREIGERHGDPTLAAAGTLGQGRALIQVGRVTEGLALLDEAMVAALSERLNPGWTGNIYCHLMEAAEQLGDLPRARQWTEVTTRWLKGMPVAIVFNGICRIHRSRIQQMAGEWEEAEAEAARVCEELVGIHTSSVGKAHYQVGEIRRLRGDFGSADDAYHRAHALGFDPHPGLALLRLAQGKVGAAASSIRSALLAERRPLRRARLCSAAVEIALAAGDLEGARAALEELAGIAETYRTSGLGVAAGLAQGAVLLAEQRPAEALPVLWETCRHANDSGARYDCARVRARLAEAYRLLDDEEAANRELEAAAAVFERLGAGPDLAAARGCQVEREPPCGLTAREVEVLVLVAAGSSNRQVARELFLSEKTVARHLANIFGKLGVTSRTGAAAFAFQHGLAHPPRR